MVRDDRLALRATWLATQLAGRVSRRLAAPLAARLWFTPWRLPVGARTREREQDWLASTVPISVRAGGLDLSGFTAGPEDAPTVLLVHGWGERAAGLGAFVAPLTEAGFRVVGVDRPSHGASPDGPTDLYSNADILREVAAAVGRVEAVVAHSIGGAVTVLALRDGLDVGAVVLLAPAVRLEHAVDGFGALFRLPRRAVDGLRDHLESRFGADVWADLAGDLVAPDLDVPALIVHDRDDPQIAPADVERLAAAWHEAELESTEGLGHVKLARDPSVVERAVAFVGAARGAAVAS